MNGTPDAVGLPSRAQVEHERNPCPHRIVDDAGGAFAMGAVGGSVWHFIKGARNSPRGGRFIGAIDAVKLRAPALGGSFAMWGGCYSLYDCTLQGIRGKEDPWNSIASGALSSATLSLRNGLKVAGRSAVAGGVILALIEGMGIVLNRYSSGMASAPPPPEARGERRGLGDTGLAGVGAWAAAAEPSS